MDLTLALLVLWGMLCAPIGLVLHGLVLGEGARVRALPIAPLSGLAAILVVLAALGRWGVPGGDPRVAWVLVAVASASGVIVWRGSIAWRSKELLGSSLLLLLGVVLVQLAVAGAPQEGPLGYGAAVDPVAEVRAVDEAASMRAGTDAAREHARMVRARPLGFEQLAAMTVSLGVGRSSVQAVAQGWTAYSLHARITGLLAALTILPLFAFARARGVGALGLLVLVPVGVFAPAVFLALAHGQGAAIASVPFTEAAVFSLLVTRRDRGWWALAVLFGAAVVVSAGMLALVPLLSIAAAWLLLRSTTYEHLSQLDAPVARERALGAALLFSAAAAVATVPQLRAGGQLLAWTALHDTVPDAVRSWPFAWLDTTLRPLGPVGVGETIVWLAGPVLLAVAAALAVARNERRELGVLVGSLAAVVIALLVAAVAPSDGVPLIEFVLLSISPLLAALAVRAVVLAREQAAEAGTSRAVRWIGMGPTLLVLALVLMSLSATTVTGTRMVHAPALAAGVGARVSGPTLVAAGDRWVEFVVEAMRVAGGYADADAISGRRLRSVDNVLLSSSPLSSDLPPGWVEQSVLDGYQVRLMRRMGAVPAPERDYVVDSVQVSQRARDTSTRRAVPGVDTNADPALTMAASLEDPLRHLPAEDAATVAAPDQPAGLLLPSGPIDACAEGRDVAVSGACDPALPLTSGTTCSVADVLAVRTARDDAPQQLDIDTDLLLQRSPPLLGVQCLDVELDPDAVALTVHVRDVGTILDARAARPVGRWRSRAQGARRASSERDASLSFGAGRLVGAFDLVLEGSFGAGVSVAGSLDAGVGASTDMTPTPIADVRGAVDGFSSILRQTTLPGSVVVANASGTDVEIGRVFARSRDLPRSCNIPLAARAGSTREVRVDPRSASGESTGARAGLTATVISVTTGDDGIRRARIGIGSYLARAGLPRHVLVDWTEQYGQRIQVEGCDGSVVVEPGAAAGTSRMLDPSLLADALHDRAQAVRDSGAASEARDEPDGF